MACNFTIFFNRLSFHHFFIMIADIIRPTSPLCSFMEQLGKSVAGCTIELVEDNARSHSPVQMRRTTTQSNLMQKQNRWNATCISNDRRLMATAFCRSPSNKKQGSTTTTRYDDLRCRIEVPPGQANPRWSSCENSSSSLTLTHCGSKRRSGRISHTSPLRNSADTIIATATAATATPTKHEESNKTPTRPQPSRSWSSPTVCAHAPTFARPHSPMREREHGY